MNRLATSSMKIVKMTKMSNLVDPPGPCNMCNQSYEWHQTHFARHPYTPPGSRNELRDATRDKKPSQARSDAIVRTTTPFDPVLRLALIEAGVITVDQLTAAEMKLRAVSADISEVLERNDRGREHAGVDAHASPDEE
jgi:hypothetical protein